jgi:hypothetical protein
VALAPERFVQWLNAHSHVDRRFGHVYRYHSRSDAHSIALCDFILDDLLDACQELRQQAALGQVVYGTNYPYIWPSTGKAKTLDLALGRPERTYTQPATPSRIEKGVIAEVIFSCEAKSVMTEHGKSKPRVYDELSSSHEIVHQGNPEAIATGITVVNIADTFVSPLRQTSRETLVISRHKQPDAAAGMVQHLRGLPIRDEIGRVGFDAYASFVVDLDNRGEARLHTDPPAPQPGERDHYETFVARASRFYAERFSSLSAQE